MTDDHELLSQIRLGNSEAFDLFYRETAPRLFAFLRQMMRDREAAEDVMQEAFTQMWSGVSGYSPEKGNLRGYLFGIARKRALGWWRGKGQKLEAASLEPSWSSDNIASLVSDAFQKLNEEQRSLLWLREVEGQSYAELAVIFDVPIGTVRSRLFTAREELRAVWHATQPVKKEAL
jgi:RNA polymerase sigma-70 factor, ECF subfamily